MSAENLKHMDDRMRVMETSNRYLTDQIAELTVQTRELPAQIGSAVEAAMTRALTNPELHASIWQSVISQAQRTTAEKTGRWLFSAAKGLVSRWLLIAFVVMMVGKAAGIQAAVQVFNWLTGKP